MAKQPPYRHFNELESQFAVIKSALICAACALNDAENEHDADLFAAGNWVLSDCIQSLKKYQLEFDAWYTSHNHTAKEEPCA